MAQWDAEKGRIRPTWTVRFTPWMTFLGSALAGIITAVVFFLTLITGPGLDALNEPQLVFKGAVLLFGLIFLVFVILGPTLAWGLGFALRSITNQSIHVIAFAILGLIVGSMLGGFIGMGGALAPAAGIGAGLARWIMSPFAKI